MKEIIKDDGLLHIWCNEIDPINEKESVEQIINDITEVMNKNTTIKGLSANQLGYDARIFGIRNKDKIKFFINPAISSFDGLVISQETSESLEDSKQVYLVPRNSYIKVFYQNEKGAIKEGELMGEGAIVFQRMFWHLNGQTIKDLGVPQPKNFTRWGEEKKNKFYEEFIATLQKEQEDLEKEIEENKDLKDTQTEIAKMSVALIGQQKEEEANKPKLNREQRRKLVKGISKMVKVK